MPNAYRPRHGKKNRLKPLLLAAAVLLEVVLIVWMAIEPGSIQLDRHTIVNSALSEDVNQLRILYVSDIHLSSWPFFSDVNALVTRINEQKPDLVLFGGDYANSSEGAIEFFRKLPPIRAIYGVYAVMGECDRTLPESNLQLLKSAMITAKVTPIVNEVVPVRIGTKNIYLAGVDDVSVGFPELNEVAQQCRSEDLTIFLCHNPDIIPEALSTCGSDGRRNWFDLGLFGHTHGGQVALFGPLLGLKRSESMYQQGWYNPNRIELLVSRGIGTCSLPIRMGRAPQMHLITIKSK